MPLVISIVAIAAVVGIAAIIAIRSGDAALEFVAGVLMVAAVVAVVIPIALWYAFVASHLWAWFIAPTFNVPEVTVLQMWGICLTINMMRAKTFVKKDETNYRATLIGIAIGPPLVLGMGYLIKFWWM